MPTKSSARIIPVILSGGAGTRLWPMSRESYPKQLLPLLSDRTMIQETVLRCPREAGFGPPLVVCANEHRFLIAEQLRQIRVQPMGIVLEPVGRNTAAAVAIAATIISEREPGALMLVLPADHAIRDPGPFREAVAGATPTALDGALLTFGIHPTAPETGYGYIRRGDILDAENDVYKVAEFVEKPDLETAKAYLTDGEHFWNSGMFLFRPQKYIEELGRYEPEVLGACVRSLAKGFSDLDFFRLDPDSFAQSPSTSIDYGVMERTAYAAMVPLDVGWTDVGSWAALWQLAARDGDGNALIGDVMVQNSRNCYVRSDSLLTAVVGLEDAVVVVSDDAVMVASMAEVQDIKDIVSRLKGVNRSEAIVHRQIHRPWGSYQTVDLAERFRVKRLEVLPGSKLSLQKHFHRAEHWVVVKGTAQVLCNGENHIVCENESIYIPIGAEHRIENPGKIPLHIIEVQSGSYLGEDDIVRTEDQYGRTDG
jgi:mannose-1-phosphate guanylyltransferase/mannose-1-phosphate guanylyltransferase/mannose-6-phosphate isomerase